MKILVVDDEEINRSILEYILSDEYEVVTAGDGEEALEVIEREQDKLAVVLLDIYMPKLDGFGVLRYLSAHGLIEKLPVLMISAESSPVNEREALTYGASDFLRKPFDPIVVRQRVNNVVELFIYKESLEQQVERQIGRIKKQARELKESRLRIIDVLGTVVESRNLESGEHIQRVKQFTKILATKAAALYPEYGLSAERIRMISAASALHDIGKIAIPDSILLKPGRLTPEEFNIMKGHTIKGCEILEHIENAWDEEYGRVSYEICRHHHERYDGSGYPDGLIGEEISIEAQLVSIADVYDALINARVYKSAYDKERAYNMIINGECGAFSPKLIDCFIACREDLEACAIS